MAAIWQGPTTDQVDKQIEMLDNALSADSRPAEEPPKFERDLCHHDDRSSRGGRSR